MEIADFVARWPSSPFGATPGDPWRATQEAVHQIGRAMADLGDEYRGDGDIAIHRSAQIEPGATVKGPAIIGPRCFVSASALLRGGVFLEADCTVGPGVELKTVFMFAGAKVAHLNFVGDSIIGSDVNIEAGAVIANYRNELDDKTIRIASAEGVIDTGVVKFGALVGDGARIGANAVIAPGALLPPGFRVARLGLVDQHPAALPR